MTADPTPRPIIACLLYATCWACNFDQHDGGPHTWADADDIEHAAATGQADPSTQLCGCWCAKGPVLAESIPDEPGLDDDGLIPPCPVCGEAGACGYDAEGRPMIHADLMDEDGDDE